jgi:hypothetical protein
VKTSLSNESTKREAAAKAYAAICGEESDSLSSESFYDSDDISSDSHESSDSGENDNLQGVYKVTQEIK